MMTVCKLGFMITVLLVGFVGAAFCDGSIH